MAAKAQGAEIRLSGKLPSDRAKSWRFASGYLKKTGDTANIVRKAQSIAQTIPGSVGIKVSILPPEAEIHDRIIVDEELLLKLKSLKVKEEPKKTKKKRRKE
jgi:small subunit ribosomal protein S3